MPNESGDRLRSRPGYFYCHRYRCTMHLVACGAAVYGAERAAEEVIHGTPVSAIPPWQLNRLRVCGRCAVACHGEKRRPLFRLAYAALRAEYNRLRAEMDSVDWLFGDEPWARRREGDRRYRVANRERRAEYNRQWRKRKRKREGGEGGGGEG